MQAEILDPRVRRWLEGALTAADAMGLGKQERAVACALALHMDPTTLEATVSNETLEAEATAIPREAQMLVGGDYE